MVLARIVTGRKRKELETSNSLEHSDPNSEGSSGSETSMLRRQIGSVRLSSDASSDGQGQSPALTTRQVRYEAEPRPGPSNQVSVVDVSGSLRSGTGLNFNRSFAERQPLPDSDQSMPGLATTSESSSEDENEFAFSIRPWYRPEE